MVIPNILFQLQPKDFLQIFIIILRSVYKELHADHETGTADNK